MRTNAIKTPLVALVTVALVAVSLSPAAAAVAAPASADAPASAVGAGDAGNAPTPQAAAGQKCVEIYRTPDGGETWCVQKDPECPILVKRTTVWGSYTYCYPPQPAASGAGATDGGPNCFPVYNEYHVGPVTVVQRSTCSYQVYYDDQWAEEAVENLVTPAASQDAVAWDGCRRVLFLHWVDYSRHYVCLDGDGDLGDGECTVKYRRDGIDSTTEKCLATAPATSGLLA